MGVPWLAQGWLFSALGRGNFSGPGPRLWVARKGGGNFLVAFGDVAFCGCFSDVLQHYWLSFVIAVLMCVHVQDPRQCKSGAGDEGMQSHPVRVLRRTLKKPPEVEKQAVHIST